MSQTGYYLKGSGRGSIPGRLCVVVVTPAAEHDQIASAEYRRECFGTAAVALSSRSGQGYSLPSVTVHPSADSVWNQLESAGQSRRRLLVVSPGASDTLTWLGWPDRIDQCGARFPRSPTVVPGSTGHCDPDDCYTVHRLILRGKPDILEYTRRGQRTLWVGTANYLPDPEHEVAAAVGYQWAGRSDADDSPQYICPDPAERALMWMRAMQRIIIWWRDRKAGRFPATAPMMARSLMYSRLAPRTVCTHTNEDVVRLERDACHGGRATAWYTGDVRPRGRYTDPRDLDYPSSGTAAIAGPIHHWDVSSMYPALMCRHEFPLKLLTVRDDLTPESLRELMTAFHVVARVTLETATAEYPHRAGERVLYPVGRFRATLASPDLLAAIDDQSLRSIHTAAVYTRGMPLAAVARELLTERATQRAAGNLVLEAFAKSVANSMTGKLTQRPGRWVECPGKRLRIRWGELPSIDDATGIVTRYRALAGLIWRFDRSALGKGTLPAIYAHLTSYGRVMMRRIRESLPYHSVLSQDTDGLWVTAAAHRQLTRTYSTAVELAGSMRLKRSATSARFWDSAHYCADGAWVAAGLSGPVFVRGTASFSHVTTVNALRTSPIEPPREVVRVTRGGELSSLSPAGAYGRDGWLTPYRLPCKLPWQAESTDGEQRTLFGDA